MKTILRNFLCVLKRFKMAALLNVLGLSVAFTAFILIMMQENFDRNFDREYSQADRIYRMDMGYGGKFLAVNSRPFTRLFLTSSPHIEAGALQMAGFTNSTLFFTIDKGGVKVVYREPVTWVTPEYTQVFSFKMYDGDANALNEPQKVLIPLSMARKLFGEESAVGKQLSLEEPGDFVTIGGVYDDFPLNSSVANKIYRAIDKDENYDVWENSNYFCFVRLDSPANAEAVIENFKKNVSLKEKFGDDFVWGPDGYDIRLTSLSELHYVTNVDWDTLPKANKGTLLVLFAIGFIIVIIAGINFTNFSTALAPVRIKSLNTQKVLGSSGSVLRTGLIVEAVGISLLAYLLSLLFLYLLQFTSIVRFVDGDTSLPAHLSLIVLTALLAIGVGLFAGLYPAYYMTSFQPALVLKGSFGLSPRGRRLRNMLIGIQFVASFALIIGALFMYLQNQYMQHTPLGYDKDALIVSDMNDILNKNREALSNQLKGISGVDGTTFSQFLLSSSDGYMGWGRSYRDKDINFQCLPVDPSFLKVMGIEVKEGRDFREEDGTSASGFYIFNERARSDFELELNEKIDGSEIVGFMPDVKFASFRKAVEPMAFYVWGKKAWGREDVRYNNMYVKVKAGYDLRTAIGQVRSILKQFDPEYPFNVRFYDEILNLTYEKEQKISALITLFSLLTVFISIVGVFGLVVFESEYRKKEIGVRKVLGSTTSQILILFNKTYLYILLFCFVVAAPIAGYAVYRWLENFAYRTPMHWWVYAVSFLAVSIITLLTVTFQNWRAANENPVHSIKAE